MLRRRIATGDEVGAALSVIVDGELTMDLWGGWQDPDRRMPWTRDTIVNLWSNTKLVVLADLYDTEAAAARMASQAPWWEPNFSLVAFGSPSSGIDEWWTRLQPHFEGMYLSFESDTGPDALARAFPPPHLKRLGGLKRRYDPSGLFRDNFFIDPRTDTLHA